MLWHHTRTLTVPPFGRDKLQNSRFFHPLMTIFSRFRLLLPEKCSCTLPHHTHKKLMHQNRHDKIHFIRFSREYCRAWSSTSIAAILFSLNAILKWTCTKRTLLNFTRCAVLSPRLPSTLSQAFILQHKIVRVCVSLLLFFTFHYFRSSWVLCRTWSTEENSFIHAFCAQHIDTPVGLYTVVDTPCQQQLHEYWCDQKRQQQQQQ